MYKYTENDREFILDYISAEPEMNLFIYGDIENFGVESDPVSIYGLGNKASPDGILLKYFDYYIFYSRCDDCPKDELITFLSERKVDCVSGKNVLIEKLAPYFPERTVRPTFMSRCDRVTPGCCRPLPQGAQMRVLGADDIDALLALELETEEFADGFSAPDAAERERRSIEVNMQHGSLHYGVFVDGTLVSIAGTSADNSRSAMVVGVATKKGYRGRGYASCAVAGLCEASFAAGRDFLCLFYDNPAAGRIYHRIGFTEIGSYSMLR